MATRFFKIIVKPRDHRLRLPSEFMRRYGRNLPDHVFLKAPGGSVRDVKLLRSNGKTWLHKGWQEFKEYYSIGFGHLLVFTYDGNSHFDVFIYDMTGVEIEYPLDNTNGDEGTNLNRTGARVPETIDIESESDDSVVLLSDFFTRKRKGERKNIEMTDHKGNDHFVEISEEDSSATTEQRKKKTVRSAVCKETCKAYQKAKSSKFCDSFHISIMQPSYVSPPFTLSIPSSFAIPNLPKVVNDIKLRLLDGKTWFVKCIVVQFNTKLGRGWKKFVLDNALKLGDACVFEVSKNNPLVWNATIFRS